MSGLTELTEKLNPLLGMARGIATGLALLAAFAAGWHANGWRKDAAIAAMKAEQAETRSAAAENAIRKLSLAAGTINNAATAYAASGAAFDKRLDTINKELKDAIAKNPLPDDCRPDDLRLRQLQAAVDAANRRAAGH